MLLKNPIYQKLKENICSKLNMAGENISAVPFEKDCIMSFYHPLQTIDNIAKIISESYEGCELCDFKKDADGSFSFNVIANQIKKTYNIIVYSISPGHITINTYEYDYKKVA